MFGLVSGVEGKLKEKLAKAKSIAQRYVPGLDRISATIKDLPEGIGATYSPLSKVVAYGRKFLKRYRPEEIAPAIIHEAYHKGLDGKRWFIYPILALLGYNPKAVEEGYVDLKVKETLERPFDRGGKRLSGIYEKLSGYTRMGLDKAVRDSGLEDLIDRILGISSPSTILAEA